MELIRENTTLYYEISGEKNAPLMVFANSLGTNLSIWDRLLPFLPKGWRFLRYDKRGHGRSTCLAPFGMNDLIEDAEAIIEAAGGSKVVFVGLSIGGMIGLGLCAKRPDLIRGFVLMDSAAKIGTNEFWQERIEKIKKNGIASISDALMERWFSKDYIDSGYANPWKSMVESTSLEGYLHCCQAIADTDFMPSTRKLNLPTLALVGEHDEATPPDLVGYTTALIRGSRFSIIRNARHIPCVEQAEETARAMSSFMRNLK